MIDHYVEVLQLESDNYFLNYTISQAERTTQHKKTAEALIDQALAKFQETIDLTTEYEGTTGTGATPDTRNVNNAGQNMNNVFVKKASAFILLHLCANLTGYDAGSYKFFFNLKSSHKVV